MELRQIYIDPYSDSASAQINIPNMGLNVRMPSGLVRHGGKGATFGSLIVVFHSPARAYSSARNDWVNVDGHFMVWDLEDEHHFGNEAAPWEHSWIWFRSRRVEQTIRNSLVPVGVPIDLNGGALPMRYLKAFYDELRSSMHQDPEMLQSMIHTFWHDLERHVTARSVLRTPDPRLERARQYIEATFDGPFSLKEAAAQAHLSMAHFCHCFAKKFGVPPREYAMQLRMQRASQLLGNRELAIFQVAEMVGCPDAHYFSRLFRKRYGMSPNQYRLQERQKSSTPPPI